MIARLFVVLSVTAALACAADAPPDLTGIWSPGGGGRGGAPAILQKGEYKTRRDELQKKVADAQARGEQYAVKGLCSPYGMPTMMQVAVYPMEVLQTPQQVTIIGEAFSEVRRVYIGKQQQSLDDVAPGWYGHSVGHWEGSTLVVDTVGVKESVPGYQNLMHGEKMHITERISRPMPNRLEDQITIEDPDALEKPVTYTLAYRKMENYEMVEFVCDNNREYVDDNGIVRMRLHSK